MIINSPWIRKPDFTSIKKLDYEEYWRRRGFEIAKKLKPREKIMLDMIPAGSSVLDVACGNSFLPLKLKERGDRVRVSDISNLVIGEFRQKGIEAGKIDLENPEEINFGEKFDFVILSEVLEHTKNPEEIVEKLKPFARHFLITVPNSAAYQFRYGLMFRGRFFTQWVYHPAEHLRFWSHLDFMDWLKALGLEVERVRAAEGFSFRGFLPWLPDLWKNFLGYRMVYLCKIKDKDNG